jgi:hypothetical protein
MKVYNLTKAHIQRINDSSTTILKLSLLDVKNLDDNPFLLIIQSIIENSLKISIYPLKKKKIIKLTFSTIDFSDEIFERISNILQNYQIIHTSGVLIIENQFYYECYLNINLDEARAMGLNDSLNKIKNIFKQIKIEEIGLKKHN